MKRRDSRHTASTRPGNDDPADTELFERAMADVVRLAPDPRGRAGRTHPATLPPHTPAAEPSRDNPVESYAAPGIDRRTLGKLRRGEYGVGARLDLHRMTRSEARDAVRRFVESNRRRGVRCVCIVHGQGLHSPAGASALKPAVRSVLRTDSSVLAFADAPAGDGGPGAVYVLLRASVDQATRTAGTDQA